MDDDGLLDSAANLVRRAARVGVTDERILAAMARVSRADFVPPSARPMAFVDEALPIPGCQTTSQPSLVAMMLQALSVRDTHRVLEVGTGYGWQTALLAALARHVWSIDRVPELVADARENLARAGITNVTVECGDGSQGMPDHAPFDRIIVSAAFPEVPAPLVDQLREGGLLVQPVGPGGAERVVVFEKIGGELQERSLVSYAAFVPLITGD